MRTPLLEMARWAVREHRASVCEFLRLTSMMEEQAKVSREFKRGVFLAGRRGRTGHVVDVIEDECQRAERFFDHMDDHARENAIAQHNGTFVAMMVGPLLRDPLSRRCVFSSVPLPISVCQARNTFARDHVRPVLFCFFVWKE